MTAGLLEPGPSGDNLTGIHRRGFRIALMLPAALCLLAGLDAALILLQVWSPLPLRRLAELHGILLVLGFVGTLISLERAVALRRASGFLAPAGFGLGGILILTPAPLIVGQLLLLVGAAAMTLVYIPLWRRQYDESVAVQLLGAASATAATALWLSGHSVAEVLPWLAGFPILTIAGERLELARIAMGPHAGTWLIGLSSTTMATLVAATLWPPVGTPLVGVSLLVLTLWLVVNDIARKTVRANGLVRFSAASMLAGYAWLIVAALVWMMGIPSSRAAYDAVIHAVFLGFTMSMIMAHAPTILPAVLRRPLPYHAVMWIPLAVLHLGLILRVWIGDGLAHRWAWQAGGVLNVIALLAFAVVVLTRLLTQRKVKR